MLCVGQSLLYKTQKRFLKMQRHFGVSLKGLLYLDNQKKFLKVTFIHIHSFSHSFIFISFN